MVSFCRSDKSRYMIKLNFGLYSLWLRHSAAYESKIALAGATRHLVSVVRVRLFRIIATSDPRVHQGVYGEITERRLVDATSN
jgi:hypothetical protein